MKRIFLIAALFFISIASYSQKRLAPFKSKENLLNEEYCTGLFKTSNGTYFDFMDPRINMTAMGYRNVLDWLEGRVAGLQVYRARDNISIPYIRNQRAAVYINEVPVDADAINLVSVPDIAMIKIIKDPFVSSWRGPGGAIVIYTVRGDDDAEETLVE